MTNNQYIKLSNCCLHYTTIQLQKVEVLQNINFEIENSEFIVFVGPSGCGKTTILRLLSGLILSNAEITGSVSILGISPDEARKAGFFGFAFQNPALLPWRNVVQNITLPLELRHQKDSIGKVDKLLKIMNLEKFMNAYPRELSGGMQQRVNIARALVLEPKILLMDEPFGALDELQRERLNVELRKIHDERGTTTLFVTHNLREATFLADRIIFLTNRPAQIFIEIRLNFSTKRTRYLWSDIDFINKHREVYNKFTSYAP
jgi:NitT/TauT family transport system ATP-binding protein